MNIYLDVQSPAVKEAGTLASNYGLANHGLVNLRRAYWNLPTPSLFEESIFRSEGSLSHLGPLVVNAGKHTARAAADKFVVREPPPTAARTPRSTPASSYTGTSVSGGTTYYYVSTSVDSTGTESAYSNQATAAIP